MRTIGGGSTPLERRTQAVKSARVLVLAAALVLDWGVLPWALLVLADMGRPDADDAGMTRRR